ncbi:MAG TPA: flavin reductase family protein [Streptosporangiaceae bacterium]
MSVPATLVTTPTLHPAAGQNNVLAEPQRHLSTNFARRGFAAVWDEVRHRPGATGSPRLHAVLAVLECTAESRLPGG